jgi:hypothetical protein
LWDPISKNPITKRAGRVAQGVGSEFKLQYHKKKRKNWETLRQADELITLSVDVIVWTKGATLEAACWREKEVCPCHMNKSRNRLLFCSSYCYFGFFYSNGICILTNAHFFLYFSLFSPCSWNVLSYYNIRTWERCGVFVVVVVVKFVLFMCVLNRWSINTGLLDGLATPLLVTYIWKNWKPVLKWKFIIYS